MNHKIFSIILVVFLIGFVSSANIEIDNQSLQDQTLLAKISGNFLNPLTEENVFLYKRHIRMPFDPELREIEGDYYLYGQILGKEADNYSIVLENIQYEFRQEVIEEEVYGNFSITEEKASFIVSPGYIITNSDEIFKIKVENLRNSETTIKILTEEDKKSSFFDIFFGGSTDEENVTLQSGESGTLELSFDNITTSQFREVILESGETRYEIPVYVVGNEEEKTIYEEKEIDFYPQNLNISLSTNSNTKRILYLENTGNEDVYDIEFILSDNIKDYLNLSKREINLLEFNESKRLVLDVSSNDEETSIIGDITAKTNDSEVFSKITIYLNFIPDFIPSNNDSDEDSTTNDSAVFSCSELGGDVCGEGEVCSGDFEYATDGKCCLDICEEKEQKGSTKLIGWIIIAVLAILVIWFFVSKYRNSGSSKIDLLKIAKGKKK